MNVTDVLAGPTAGTVFVAGRFTTVNGVAHSHLALLNATTGALVAGFKAPSTNGVVNTITKAGNRLLLGGNFTVAGGQQHQGLAAINQSTGVIDHAFMALDVTEHHNNTGSGSQGAVGVRDMEATPDGTRMVAIGNFRKVEGIDRDQAVVIGLSGAAAAVDLTWRTRRYEPLCFNWAFDTYVRGVAVSPDGKYFVVNATGGHNTGTLCDVAARFEFGSVGDDVQPTWTDDAGGDTLWGVEITEKAVFIGGHQRWLNNSDGSDFAGQGAVPRPGLAALDTETGLPLKWNPGRLPRGAAVYEIYATPAGLWVGSDTDYIGNYKYKRPKLAFFPLAGGAPERADTVATLPGGVYLGGPRTVSQGNVLYRVNAGGSEIEGTDGGPSWVSDSGTTSPYRNTGSNASTYNPGATVDASVPASTPNAVFNSERWSPSDNPRMSWSFPVAAAQAVQVRLFFSNRCTCTSSAGSRAFDVTVEGNKVLDNYDIVADVGDQKGTMKSFNVTSDGTVNIDFGHRTENPLVNAIEIVDPAQPAPAPAPSTLSAVDFDGTTATGPSNVDARGVDWANVRGAFLAGDTLVYGKTDGYLYERTFTKNTTGPATKIDPYNDPAWAEASDGVGGTERGALPSLYGQLPSLTGMFYSEGRLFYTLRGDSRLRWRWFNLDSGIVGSQVFTASATGWSDTGGMFKSGNTLYVVSASTGNLFKVPFSNGQPTGAPTLADAGRDWRAKAVFIGPSAPQANVAPEAAFTVSCAERTCTVDGSGSSDSDGSVASYAWSFGDTSSATTATPAPHTYGADGHYAITLTVTDDDGATGSLTKEVDVAATPPPASDLGFVGQNQASAQSAAPSVSVPAAVQAGDQLILVGSYALSGTTSVSATAPAGWSLASSRIANGLESRVWTRSAVAGEGGSAVPTSLSAVAKSTLTLAAYRGVASSGGIAAIASATDGSTMQHTSPTVTAPAGAWVVQLWSDKSSGTTAWTAPGGTTVRGTSYGAGTGRTSALLTDSGGPVSAGTRGGQVASTDAASGRAIAWTIALKPSP